MLNDIKKVTYVFEIAIWISFKESIGLFMDSLGEYQNSLLMIICQMIWDSCWDG